MEILIGSEIRKIILDPDQRIRIMVGTGTVSVDSLEYILLMWIITF